MLKDRRFQLAIGAAVLLGVVTLVRRKGAGDAGSPAAGAATGSYQPQAFDSTGTDIASFLGGLQTAQQQTLTDFADSIRDQLEELGNRLPPTPSTPDPRITPPSPVVTPVPSPAPRQTTWVVRAGDSLSKIASILRGKGWTGQWQDLYNTNKGVIGGNPNLIHPNQVLTIPNPPPF